MATIIATQPRPGNGNTLVRGAAELLHYLFGANRKAAVKKTEASAAPAQMSIWQLYRLTVGYDSISPKTAAKLRKQLVG